MGLARFYVDRFFNVAQPRPGESSKTDDSAMISWTERHNPMKSRPSTSKQKMNSGDPEASEEHLHRLRRICFTLPGTSEKLSHGEPTFFVKKRVYAMFANNHHNDGHIAVWIAAPPGLQAALVKTEPEKVLPATVCWRQRVDRHRA